MIFLQLSGGLGNQMFQFAFAKKIQMQTGESICINTYGFRNDPQREYSLGVFRLSSDVHILDEKQGRRLWKRSQFLNKCLYKLKKAHGEKNFYKLSRLGLYFTFDIYEYYKYALPRRKNKIICGNFQTDKYFIDIRQDIVNAFRLQAVLKDEVNRMKNEIQNCESVCVHIRRGDYVTNVKDNRELNICTEKYYYNAMKLICSRIENPVFYIFSNTHDDLEWIKVNYNFDCANIKYVDMNNTDYEELTLMCACHHFIIANSTYSWWAQFLGCDSHKTVVAPKTWYAGGQDASDIYEDNWEIVGVD